ncbi:sigma-70 family RNA polymerase sigma factor [soil metagenome]
MSMAFELRDPEEHVEPAPRRDPGDIGDWFEDALPRLFGYFIVRVGGSSHDAEDLTQETMLAAVRSMHDPPGDVPIMAWLYGIARHKLIDHYRREDRVRRQFGQGIDPGLIDIEPSAPVAHLDLDSIHVRDDIIATIHRLPPRQRSAMVLRYFDGCDVSTTAVLLDASVHATESLLARGRVTFRRIYREITGEPT